MSNPLLAPLTNWLSRLRNPYLFVISGILFCLSLLIPDALPFVDELLLATLAIWLGNRKRDRKQAANTQNPHAAE